MPDYPSYARSEIVIPRRYEHARTWARKIACMLYEAGHWFGVESDKDNYRFWVSVDKQAIERLLGGIFGGTTYNGWTLRVVDGPAGLKPYMVEGPAYVIVWAPAKCYIDAILEREHIPASDFPERRLATTEEVRGYQGGDWPELKWDEFPWEIQKQGVTVTQFMEASMQVEKSRGGVRCMEQTQNSGRG